MSRTLACAALAAVGAVAGLALQPSVAWQSEYAKWTEEVVIQSRKRARQAGRETWMLICSYVVVLGASSAKLQSSSTLPIRTKLKPIYTVL